MDLEMSEKPQKPDMNDPLDRLAALSARAKVMQALDDAVEAMGVGVDKEAGGAQEAQ